MSGNAQKTHYVLAQNRFAATKVADAIQLLGKSLPASVTAISGSIVTVKFELTNTPFPLPPVTVPLAGAEYIRYPIEVGCKGEVSTVDAYMGAMTGLGSGTADLSVLANLSNLVFQPVGNSGWTAPMDPNAVEIYGPNGVILHDTATNCGFILDTTRITITGKTDLRLQLNGNANNIDLSPSGITLDGPTTLTGTLNVTGAIEAGNGASGTFTTADSKTVTVANGIITSIM